jgi:hypothetical protein
MPFLGRPHSSDRGMFRYPAIVKRPQPICQIFFCKHLAPGEVNRKTMPHKRPRKPTAPLSIYGSTMARAAPGPASQRCWSLTQLNSIR